MFVNSSKVCDPFISELIDRWSNFLQILSSFHINFEPPVLFDTAEINKNDLKNVVEFCSKFLILSSCDPDKFSASLATCCFFRASLISNKIDYSTNPTSECRNQPSFLLFERLTYDSLFTVVNENLSLLAKAFFMKGKIPCVHSTAHAIGLISDIFDHFTDLPTHLYDYLDKTWNNLQLVVKEIIQTISLLELLRVCLIEHPKLLSKLSVSEQKMDLSHCSWALQLMRTLRSLCNLVHSSNFKQRDTLAFQLENLVLDLICGSRNSPNLEQDTFLPFIKYFAQSEITSQSSDFILLHPNPSFIPRLLLLCGMDIALRLDIDNGNLIPLLSSLRETSLFFTNSAVINFHVYENSLISLLFEDDSHLFRILDQWIKLEEKIYCSLSSKDIEGLIPNPHWLFAFLFNNIGFSPHLLVDWLISPETDCLAYILHYLRRFRSGSIIKQELNELLLSNAPVNSRSSSMNTSDTVNSIIEEHNMNWNLNPVKLTSWPFCLIVNMLSRVAKCLQTLSDHNAIPFSPGALIRSINFTLDVINQLNFSKEKLDTLNTSLSIHNFEDK